MYYDLRIYQTRYFLKKMNNFSEKMNNHDAFILYTIYIA